MTTAVRTGDDHGSEDKTTVMHKERRGDDHRITRLLIAAWRRYRSREYATTLELNT